METAIGHSNWRTGPTDLLAELYSRILTAKRELNSLISEYAEYFIQTSKAIINTYNLSTEAKISLIDFTEKMVRLVNKAYPQIDQKLTALENSLKNNNVKIEITRKSTMHIVAEEGWFIICIAARFKFWFTGKLPVLKRGVLGSFPYGRLQELPTSKN